MDSMKTFRSIPPQIDGAGWTVNATGNALPVGLKAETKVTVIRIDDDRLVVLDPSGNGVLVFLTAWSES
jgi:hypothetical protein